MASETPAGVANIYQELPPVKGQRVKITGAEPFVPQYVQASLTQSSDPAGIYASRIKGRQIMLENPARDSKAKQERDAKRAKRITEKKRKQARMPSLRKMGEKGVWKLAKDQTRFELFLPLHRLWLGYMSELLGLPVSPSGNTSIEQTNMPSSAGMHAKLVKADFHGSIVTVRQSKNPCLIGLSGIVVHETENAFKVITKQDEMKLLPKQNSVFAFAVPLFCTTPPSNKPTDASHSSDSSNSDPRWTVLDGPHIEFDLYGNQFRFRSADRAGRKFKAKETIEL